MSGPSLKGERQQLKQATRCKQQPNEPQHRNQRHTSNNKQPTTAFKQQASNSQWYTANNKQTTQCKRQATKNTPHNKQTTYNNQKQTTHQKQQTNKEQFTNNQHHSAKLSCQMSGGHMTSSLTHRACWEMNLDTLTNLSDARLFVCSEMLQLPVMVCRLVGHHSGRCHGNSLHPVPEPKLSALHEQVNLPVRRTCCRTAYPPV